MLAFTEEEKQLLREHYFTRPGAPPVPKDWDFSKKQLDEEIQRLKASGYASHSAMRLEKLRKNWAEQLSGSGITMPIDLDAELKMSIPAAVMNPFIETVFKKASLEVAIGVLKEGIHFAVAGDFYETVGQVATAIAMAGAAYKENPHLAVKIVGVGMTILEKAAERVQEMSPMAGFGLDDTPEEARELMFRVFSSRSVPPIIDYRGHPHDWARAMSEMYTDPDIAHTMELRHTWIVNPEAAMNLLADAYESFSKGDYIDTAKKATVVVQYAASITDEYPAASQAMGRSGGWLIKAAVGNAWEKGGGPETT